MQPSHQNKLPKRTQHFTHARNTYINRNKYPTRGCVRVWHMRSQYGEVTKTVRQQSACQMSGQTGVTATGAATWGYADNMDGIPDPQDVPGASADVMPTCPTQDVQNPHPGGAGGPNTSKIEQTHRCNVKAQERKLTPPPESKSRAVLQN
jgi:hypothetical protein